MFCAIYTEGIMAFLFREAGPLGAVRPLLPGHMQCVFQSSDLYQGL